MARVVLVTGVARRVGEQLVLALADDERVERVIGVDVVPPRTDLGRTEFLRADIRNPMIAKVIGSAEVDTVVHLSVIATPLTAGSRAAMKEINVIGTMQLLAACQKSPSVRRLVVKSSTTVYGSSPRDPAMFSEDMEPRAVPRSGYAKDAVEVEGYVRGFGRRRPDVSVTTLRFANFMGPYVDSPLTRYFSLPIVPTPMGYDARLQFVHEEDALDVLARATLDDRGGTYNVAGDGTLLLSQAIRRAGRVPLPVPSPTATLLGQLIRRAGIADFSPEQVSFLSYGRGVDTARLRDKLGYSPKWTTLAAFDDFVGSRGLRTLVTPERVGAVERRIADVLTAGRTGDAYGSTTSARSFHTRPGSRNA